MHKKNQKPAYVVEKMMKMRDPGTGEPFSCTGHENEKGEFILDTVAFTDGPMAYFEDGSVAEMIGLEDAKVLTAKAEA